MRCTTCDYPLWNLKTRTCPECGEPFLPSEHEFVPNSVRFCCPHCDQAYYGTSTTGHLVPDAFDCVRCGESLHMDALVLRPAEGVREHDTLAERMPWIQRSEMSWFRAWRTTVGHAMIGPLRLMRSVPVGSSQGSAWWFAAATAAIVFLLGGALPLAVIALIDVLASGGNDAIELLLTALFGTMAGVLACLVLIAVWGLVTHGLLRVTGGATHGIGRTYQALCYSAGANVTSAVPCLGLYPLCFIGLTWWSVSAILMTAQAHRTSGGRAAFAVLAFPGVAVVGTTALLVGTMFWGLNQAQFAITAAVAAQTRGEAQVVLDAVIDHAAQHGGAGPAHALELLVPDDVDATGPGAVTLDEWSFVANDTMTAPGDVPLGDVTLAALSGQPPEVRSARIAAAAAALPADIVAHRVGDFVFTYHGIDPATADGALWLVVLSPDPDRNAGVFEMPQIPAGRADGTVELIDGAAFALRLEEQNELRAVAGLAALPMPESVRHGEPGEEKVETSKRRNVETSR